jgi:hypothetical protein
VDERLFQDRRECRHGDRLIGNEKASEYSGERLAARSVGDREEAGRGVEPAVDPMEERSVVGFLHSSILAQCSGGIALPFGPVKLGRTVNPLPQLRHLRTGRLSH